ncbi:MAG: NAD(P)H-quinone oxidoreductase [Sandaracinaceae bacterium]|nr:NAD(P)H-quinone oxidoreductase [Sandaracinaceae bacterium]
MIHARVVRIPEPGDPSILEIVERTMRDPGPGEVRVAVRACGLNRADLMQRRGVYPAPPGVPHDVPGLELAGMVECVGPDVTEWSVGDRVMGIVGGGAMATHVITHARALVRIPRGLDFVEAAAIPEAFMTAWDALFVQGGLRPGMTVLVHAVASGVGTAVVQIARKMGATVFGTSRSHDKLARLGALGLAHRILVSGSRATPPAFAAELLEQSGGHGADLIIDTVGAAYLEENVRALAPRGTIVCLGLLAGANGTLPLGLLLSKRGKVVGSVLRSRPLEEKISLAQGFAREALPWFERRELSAVIDRVLPIEEVAEAHRAMELDANVGKIVLVVPAPID